MIDERASTAHDGDGDAGDELRATVQACALGDRSDLARLLGDGPDLLGLLQRLGTGDVAGLAPGQGKATVLTTNKGRIVERLFVQHLGPRGILLVGGPGRAGAVLAHLARYTFAERTGLADASAATELISLTGPRSGEALGAAGLPRPDPLQAAEGEVAGAAVWVLGHDGISGDGFSVLTDRPAAAGVLPSLTRAVRTVGGRPCGPEALEANRILRGVPASGSELTEDHNPLEAGLWDAVSFDKGCYVGQEVVARLRTYDKVARTLWALRLPAGAAAPAPGTGLFADGREVGRITSSVVPPGWRHPVALAYVKHRNLTDGATLTVGTPDADLRALRTALPIAGEED